MSINAAQKLLCFFIIFFYNQLSAMELQKKFKEYTSKIVFSDTKQVAAFAIGMPLIAAGTIAIFNNADKISSSFENISMPEGNTLLGVTTVAAMPVAYMYAQTLTPEAQFAKYTSWLDKNIKENVIVKNGEAITTILRISDVKDKQKKLEDFVNRKFALEAHKKHPSITAVEEIGKLEQEIFREANRLKQIGDTIKMNQDSLNARNDLKELKKNIRDFRTLIIGHPEYKEHINTYSNAKNAELKEQKFTYSTKYGSIMSALAQPISQVCLVFLQLLFAKLGIAQ